MKESVKTVKAMDHVFVQSPIANKLDDVVLIKELDDCD